MRVALICYHTSPLAALGSSTAGGMNLYVRRLAEGLGRAGIAVDVFTRRVSSRDVPVNEIGPDVRLFNLPAGPQRVVPKSKLAEYTLEFGKALAAVSSERRLEYDVIHSHYWLSGLAALALRHEGQPLVHMFHTLSRVKRAYQPDSGSDDAACRDCTELRILRAATTLVFATPAEVDDVRRLYGVRPASVALIPPGVDQEQFHPIDAELAKRIVGVQAKRVILCVGRMDRAKGFDYLLTAVGRLRRSSADALDGLKVVIVGGNDERRDGAAGKEVARLKTIARNLRLGNIVGFRGVVPQDELPLYYAAADVCAVPSRYESFGMVALEAMSAGRPVVGFRSRGLEQTVVDGRSGILVQPGDSDAFADALARVLSDPTLARRLGMTARESIRRFTWDAVVEKHRELYMALVARPLAVAR